MATSTSATIKAAMRRPLCQAARHVFDKMRFVRLLASVGGATLARDLVVFVSFIFHTALLQR